MNRLVKVLLYGLFALHFLAWFMFRGGELVWLLLNHGHRVLLCLVVAVATPQIPKPVSYLVTVAALTFLMDVSVPSSQPELLRRVTPLVVVTGANSGVGLKAAAGLAEQGSHVIMACRNLEKCTAAKAEVDAAAAGGAKGGSAECRELDLGDPRSVRTFAASLERDKIAPAALLNNAGFGRGGEVIANTGLEAMFSTMFMGHFLLTELLVHQAKRAHRHLRVVNTASVGHHLCALPFYLLPDALQPKYMRPGCIDQEYLDVTIRQKSTYVGYFASKLGNVYHALELPRRHGVDTVTAMAVDLGWVQTNIQPWMTATINPANLGMMRRAADGVRPVLLAVTAQLNDTQQAEGGQLIDSLGHIHKPFLNGWWRAMPFDSEARAVMLWDWAADWAKRAGLD